jgi:oligosaccharide repeat unit polymerase
LEVILGLLAATTVLSWIQCFYWIDNRRYGVGILGIAYSIVYLLDATSVGISERTYLAISVGTRPASLDSLQNSSAMVIITWWLYVGLCSLIPRYLDTRRPHYHLSDSSGFRPFIFAAVTGYFAVLVVIPILRVGIAQTLALRQSVFGSDPVVLLGYFVIPALIPLGLVGLTRVKGLKRHLTAAMILFAVGISALTGSRSGLLLSGLIPAGSYGLRLVLRRPRSFTRDLVLGLMLIALISIPVLGSTVYLSGARNVTETTSSFMESSDINQYDVLVDLDASQPFSAQNGSTYLAGITSFVPRAIWPDKPLPANVVVSEILTPTRYALTKAETTAGLLGEGFVNFGLIGGAILAAIALSALANFADRLIGRPDDSTWVLGVIVLTRGLNVLRGDSTNVIVPLLVAVLLWGSFFYKSKSTDVLSPQKSKR